jgi:hypothetical protein
MSFWAEKKTVIHNAQISFELLGHAYSSRLIFSIFHDYRQSGIVIAGH